MREPFDDDAARHALRTLTDEAAPPVTTTLDQVVRRGKRRLFVQRASAVAGVVAVVAVIGVGTILLRSGDDGVRVAGPPVSTRADSRLPGWTPVPMPAGTTRSGESCSQPHVELPPKLDFELPSKAQVEESYVRVATRIVGGVRLGTEGGWMPNSPKHGAPRGYLNLDIPMDNGTGQLMLEVSWLGGSPEHVANASITVYGNCGQPLRHTLADGTVMQLYPLDDRDAKAPSQHLQIYTSNGLMYVVTSAGWSESDLVPVAGSDAKVLRGGRGKVPVTEEQLVEVGLAMAIELG